MPHIISRNVCQSLFQPLFFSPGYTTAPPKEYTPAPNCRCGCLMTTAEGKIVTSLTCHGSTLWQIHVEPGLVVELIFEVFDLDAENLDTWVKVRDGDSHMADLLLDNDGSRLPKTVRSTQNMMFIEYMAPEKPGMNGYEVKNEGFMAIYASQSKSHTVKFCLKFAYLRYYVHHFLLGITVTSDFETIYLP